MKLRSRGWPTTTSPTGCAPCSWAGKGGGGVFSPEVNDEVLVGFEQGDLDRPYVLGGLYNGVDQPSPHDLPWSTRTSGQVNRRSLVSRTGHRLELLDGDAARPGFGSPAATSSWRSCSTSRGTASTSRYARQAAEQALSSVTLDQDAASRSTPRRKAS